ncbi:NAD(P)/FAD-dependent oxidoreductase [Corynebacterium comes]|uniref:Thioredoxin reductase n=1 Tax=Corynebacterium comes TaxID=2675218 RepID=A0A6B8VVR2_9CORY|nr:NAD(P)/FAD-dependent oxidoreductase [Corynebacterium comes]QGU04191.1 Thioredoxin reductase [Corynebacterium comes]
MSTQLPDAVDVLVVGGGPSGLAAATWLGRYQRFTLVVDAGEYRNSAADHVHGLLSRDPVAPQELRADSLAGLEQYPLVRLHHGIVNSVSRDEDGLFHATVDGSHQVSATRIVLATGIRDQFPHIGGFDEHYGIDVHHCPACDGFNALGEDVLVLGSSSRIPGFAAGFLEWARSVKIVTNSLDPHFDERQRAALRDHGIKVVEGIAEALVGDPGQLRGISLADSSLVPGSRVFFSYRYLPTNDLAADLGCELNRDGSIVVNKYQLTSISGVYAAGDITTNLKLVPVAISSGTIAGYACAASLRGHGTTPPAPPPAPPARWFI